MQNVIDKIELMFAALGAFLGWFFGGFDGFLYALIIFVVMNYFTGILAAGVKHELSSEVGFKGSIDRITPHCVVGQLSAESICGCFISPDGQASCNYGIGYDGRVLLCVEEKNRSWCTSSRENDQRAITIECASDSKHPYAFKDVVYNRLVELCIDICKHNGKKMLLWLGDKEKTLNYIPKSDEMVLTVHRFYANKSCPGDWMYARMVMTEEKRKKGEELLRLIELGSVGN